jgi:hypothetical protein
MQQAQHAHPEGDEQQRLGNFEDSNENQPTIMVFVPGRRLQWGICHGLPVERI